MPSSDDIKKLKESLEDGQGWGEITVRDLIAIEVLPSIILMQGDGSTLYNARRAYEYADSMLKMREEDDNE